MICENGPVFRTTISPYHVCCNRSNSRVTNLPNTYKFKCNYQLRLDIVLKLKTNFDYSGFLYIINQGSNLFKHFRKVLRTWQCCVLKPSLNCIQAHKLMGEMFELLVIHQAWVGLSIGMIYSLMGGCHARFSLPVIRGITILAFRTAGFQQSQYKWEEGRTAFTDLYSPQCIFRTKIVHLCASLLRGSCLLQLSHTITRAALA